jgi:hypothetical protein
MRKGGRDGDEQRERPAKTNIYAFLHAGAQSRGGTIRLVGETPGVFRAVNRDQVRSYLAQAAGHIAELKGHILSTRSRQTRG